MQVAYSGCVSRLVEHWTLDAMQCVAAAMHRLHFSHDVRAAIEAAMIKAAEDLGHKEVAECLAWAVQLGYTLLQKSLAKQIAEWGYMVDLEGSFPGNSLLVVVQALQDKIAELQDSDSD